MKILVVNSIWLHWVKITDFSSSDESGHRSSTSSNDTNTSNISTLLENINQQSQQAICNVKFYIGTRVTASKFSPNYFLNEKVVSFDVDTLIYNVHFDREDNADRTTLYRR